MEGRSKQLASHILIRETLKTPKKQGFARRRRRKIGFFKGFFGGDLFSDSLRFSASVAPIFHPKDALGGDFGPKLNFGKSRFLDPHRRGPPSAPF